jgi:hypothetical protein
MPTTRTLTPSMTGRVKFATSPAPHPPSQTWFQIRHHQDNSRANKRHRLACVLPANVASRFCQARFWKDGFENSCHPAMKIEFRQAIHQGLDDLDRREDIPFEPVKAIRPSPASLNDWRRHSLVTPGDGRDLFIWLGRTPAFAGRIFDALAESS